MNSHGYCIDRHAQGDGGGRDGHEGTDVVVALAVAMNLRGAHRRVGREGSGARDGSGEGSASPADKVVDEIKSLGGEAVASYDSVATAEGGANIVKSALDAFGTVDILINNAGIGIFKPAAELSVEEWRRVIDTNLTGSFLCCKEAFPRFSARGGGFIINISSLAGKNPFPSGAAYNASKAALNQMTRSLALEWAPTVRVNAIMPPLAAEYAVYPARPM